MIQTIKKAWGIPELRKKIIFTALILLIFRIGNAIPVPYVNTDLLSSYLEGMSTTVLGLYNVMSGGAFAQVFGRDGGADRKSNGFQVRTESGRN